MEVVSLVALVVTLFVPEPEVKKLECKYFDSESKTWVSEGISLVPPDVEFVCDTSHL